MRPAFALAVLCLVGSSAWRLTRDGGLACIGESAEHCRLGDDLLPDLSFKLGEEMLDTTANAASCFQFPYLPEVKAAEFSEIKANDKHNPQVNALAGTFAFPNCTASTLSCPTAASGVTNLDATIDTNSGDQPPLSSPTCILECH